MLTAVTFSLFGFVIGIWADGFEKLQLVPLLIVTPLTFLGGSFYSISMLPPFWQKVTLFNPVVYLISGFRWSFYGVADVPVAVCLAMTGLFLVICLAAGGVDLPHRLAPQELGGGRFSPFPSPPRPRANPTFFGLRAGGRAGGHMDAQWIPACAGMTKRRVAPFPMVTPGTRTIGYHFRRVRP